MQDMQDDIVERLNHSIYLCRNADTTANQTVLTLADQGEQLENIKIGLDTIDSTLDDTKKNIKRLKGVTQRVMDTFRTKFHKKIFSKFILHTTKKQNSFSTTSSPRRRQSTPRTIQPTIPLSNSSIDGRIDLALYEIDNLIHSLKDKAYTINDQLVGQADVIDHIQQRMSDTTDHIDKQNTDITKIIQ